MYQNKQAPDTTIVLASPVLRRFYEGRPVVMAIDPDADTESTVAILTNDFPIILTELELGDFYRPCLK
jgi:hypothetical protein